ncbi:unnamed protein product [Closterium sp. NIES-64]|nr:unnamed protein product [Closterium sp. NIES-64]
MRGASSKSPRASRAARRELEAHQEPRQEEEAGQEASPAPMGAAQGFRLMLSAGASAAAFDSGSVSPCAIPRVAQAEVEETRLGADPEQTAEVALSALPAPVSPAVLAAAVSAATGEQGDAPMAEGATTAAACAGMPVAAAASNRQEHGHAEGEIPRPSNVHEPPRRPKLCDASRPASETPVL